MNLVVGETRPLQVVDANGAAVHGLTWVVTDPTVASLSADDPPVLTALAPGHVTITAGDGSADVTVYAAALAPGTVIWSNPGDGSGVQNIVPAVPSSTGVADVFAFQASGNVQAIASDGTVAWTANLGSPYATAIPDFQGGLVINDGHSITKLDAGDNLLVGPAHNHGGDDNVVGDTCAVHRDTHFRVMRVGTIAPRFRLATKELHYEQMEVEYWAIRHQPGFGHWDVGAGGARIPSRPWVAPRIFLSWQHLLQSHGSVGELMPKRSFLCLHQGGWRLRDAPSSVATELVRALLLLLCSLRVLSCCFPVLVVGRVEN